MSAIERSVSRGRQAFQSTGRGGVGNFRQPSVDARLESGPESGPDDFSVTRGREAICHPTKIFSTGRGGVGNIRSPSRGNEKVSTIEEDIIKKYKKSQEDSPVSSGRGGVGNINRSRTRDPIRVISNVDSTSGGGVGNIVAGNGSVAGSIHEDDIKDEEYHFTGRGGNANITIKREPPPIERHQDIGDESDDQSTGRGRAGKIVKETT